ncbi:MAG: hypothetical protein HN580_26430 [Deltaproteobacteria bacterium]|nr:hypothetical protein [Deltaproteobacteria bacterium]
MFDQFVTITHPCHFLHGKAVPIIQYRSKEKPPGMLVQFPDGSTHTIPVDWTDQAEPDQTRLAEVEKDLRLSPFALMEAVKWMKEQG